MNNNTDIIELERETARADAKEANVYLNPFAAELIEGLSQHPKTLSCKWFYDERGSRLFEEITQTAEYYPTRVETMLLRALTPELATQLPNLSAVIEPGSGASIKTRILLEALPNLQTYIPLDISEEFLLQTAAQLALDFPKLNVLPVVADFTAAMHALPLQADAERLVFFPGSTIGNFAPLEARQLLSNIRLWAGSNAWLLIGVDMTQDADKLRAAYNDEAGITAQFNKNLLIRANRELDANFDISRFHHEALFNADEHRIEMHLVSDSAQSVEVLGHSFQFKQGETIHTENCYKYSRAAFTALAHECGWTVQRAWTENNGQNSIEAEFAMPEFSLPGFGVFLLKC